MNDRLAQDAADSMAGYEAQAARRAAMLARGRALRAAGVNPGPRPAGPPLQTWAPVMTEQQKQAHEQYVIDNNLPF